MGRERNGTERKGKEGVRWTQRGAGLGQACIVVRGCVVCGWCELSCALKPGREGGRE